MLAVHEGMIRLRRRVAVRREVVRPPRARPPHHDQARRRRRSCAHARCAAGPRHAGRPDREVLVRPHRRPARRGVPLRGLGARPLARSAIPAEGTFETDLFAGLRPDAGARRARAAARERSSTGWSFGKKDEAVEGPDDADVIITVAAADAAIEPNVAYMQGRLKASRPHRRAVRGAAQRRGRRGDSAGSPHRVPEGAVADQRRTAVVEQLAELRSVGDELEVVDPRLGRRR